VTKSGYERTIGGRKYVSSGRAAQMLDVSQQTVVRMCERAELKAWKDRRNGFWWVSLAALEKEITKIPA
jgi:hypothetical protein